ncbi:MAG: hypothetical protein K0S42_2869, partial [Microvirga sp.]|nr:hypothetical protein [Microvirga sp.]
WTAFLRILRAIFDADTARELVAACTAIEFFRSQLNQSEN